MSTKKVYLSSTHIKGAISIDDSSLVTMTEAAGILGFSRQNLHKIIQKEGFIDPVFYIKGKNYYLRGKVAEWNKARKAAKEKP